VGGYFLSRLSIMSCLGVVAACCLVSAVTLSCLDLIFGGWLRYVLSPWVAAFCLVSVGGCIVSSLSFGLILSFCSLGRCCGIDSSRWVAAAISCLGGLQLHCLVAGASVCLGRRLRLQERISLGFCLPHFIFGISFYFSLSSASLLWMLPFALIEYFDLQVRYMFAVVHLEGSLLR
jgi:hypothetical protein